jgi:DNA-binding CsgD family transcriptional regulator
MLEAVHALFAVDSLDEFGATVLEELENLISFDLASFNEVDPTANRASFVSRPESMGMGRPEAAAWQRLAYQNPILDYFRRTGDGSARRMSDFITRDELHALELYREVYRTIGAEYQVAVGLPCPQPLVVGIALSRTHRDFDDGEVVVLNILRAHIAQAYRIIGIRMQERTAIEGMVDALSAEGRAIIVVDGAEPVQPITGVAREVLERHFGSFPTEQLPPAMAAWLQEEQSAFLAGSPTRLIQPLLSRAGRRQLTARLVPASRTTSDAVVIDERVARVEPHRLTVFGLTDREAEVLWWVTRGGTNDQVAERLGIRPATVRKHLERIFQKLGVSNRVAAAAKVADALAASEPS